MRDDLVSPGSAIGSTAWIAIGAANLLEVLLHGVLVVDVATGAVAFANVAARRLLGNGITHCRDWEEFESMGIDIYLDRASLNRVKTPQECKGRLRADGREVSLHFDFVPFVDSIYDRPMVMFEVREAQTESNREMGGARSQGQDRRQQLLHELYHSTRDLISPTEIADTAATLLSEYFRGAPATYLAIDPTTNRVILVGRYLREEGAYKRPERLPDRDVVIDYCSTGKTLVVCDSEVDDRIAEVRDSFFRAFGRRSFVLVPLVKGPKPVAYLSIEDSVPRDWDLDDVKLVEEVAQQIWSSVDRAATREVLKSRELYYQTLTDSLPVMTWVMDEHGSFEYMNQQWTAYTGLTWNPLGWIGLVHQEDRPKLRAELARGVREQSEMHGEFRLQRTDGAYRYFRLRALPLKDPSGRANHWFGTYVDIDDERTALQAQFRALGSQQFLSSLSDLMQQSRDVPDLIQMTTESLEDHFRADVSRYLEVDLDQDLMKRHDQPADPTVKRVTSYRFSELGEVATRMMREGKSVVIGNQVDLMKMGEDGRAFFASTGIASTITVPLLRNGQLEALLGVHTRRSRRWTQEEVQLVEEAAARLWTNLDRIRAEVAVKERELQYRTLVDELPQVIWTSNPRGVLTFVSSRWQEFSGSTLPETLARGLVGFMHPDDLQEAQQAFTESFSAMKPFQFRYRLRRHDGIFRWCSFRGAPKLNEQMVVSHWLGTVTDVHSEVESQFQINLNAWRQTELAAFSREIAAIRSLTGLLDTVAERVRYILGVELCVFHVHIGDREHQAVATSIPYKEFAGKKIELIYPVFTSGNNPLRVSFERLRQEVPNYSADYPRKGWMGAPLLGPDEAEIGWIEVFDPMAPEFDESHESLLEQLVQLISVSLQNVLLNANLELRVDERTALLVQKNEELEAFTHMVSHDMRSHLRSISGNAQLIAQDEAEHITAAGKDRITRLTSATHQLGQLVDDLLQYARLEGGTLQVEPFSLRELGNQVAKLVLDERPEANIVVSVSAEPVLGDSRLLGLVIHNLFDNACKYRQRERAISIEMGETRTSEGRVFFVRDNGIGFDREDMGFLFKPFQRLHSASEYPGSGIGLANVRRVIERHGGRVWADSEQGVGSQFFFTLPEVSTDIS